MFAVQNAVEPNFNNLSQAVPMLVGGGQFFFGQNLRYDGLCVCVWLFTAREVFSALLSVEDFVDVLLRSHAQRRRTMFIYTLALRLLMVFIYWFRPLMID